MRWSSCCRDLLFPPPKGGGNSKWAAPGMRGEVNSIAPALTWRLALDDRGADIVRVESLNDGEWLGRRRRRDRQISGLLQRKARLSLNLLEQNAAMKLD